MWFVRQMNRQRHRLIYYANYLQIHPRHGALRFPLRTYAEVSKIVSEFKQGCYVPKIRFLNKEVYGWFAFNTRLQRPFSLITLALYFASISKNNWLNIILTEIDPKARYALADKNDTVYMRKNTTVVCANCFDFILVSQYLGDIIYASTLMMKPTFISHLKVF